MRLIHAECQLVTLFSVFEVFVCDILVAAKRMRVREVLVKLDRAIKELECRFVFFLKTVAVAHDTPSFRDKERFFKGKVTQVSKLVLLLEMPETGRVVLEALKTIRLDAHHLLVGFHGVLVQGLLE